uniref:antirestriction protein n=1 Tax=Escherichia coli TaxID=562 RepID=UPI002032AD7A
PQNDVTLKMPAFEWVHVQLHQQKGMISLSPPTICNSALFNVMNGNRAEMSPEAAGIAACLMTYSHHACRTENYAMTVHYYRLRDYALQHPECSAIMRIID